MKIKPEDYAFLRDALNAANNEYTRANYRKQSNSLRGYQWYLVRGAGLLPFVCDTLYQYLDDTHIQTALNRIIPEL